jgi:peptide deformylase
MFETMYAAQGVGLAAPQIGVSLRVVVVHVPEGEPFALINPEFVRRSGHRRVIEGCLSVPGYRGEITRSVNVTVKGLSPEGKEVRVRASNDLLAEALEHEIDHINGTLYVDYLESIEQLQKIEPREEEADEEEMATEQ